MSYEVDLANPSHSGKVRDSFFLSDEEMMVVASDRVSVFDVVLPTPIPGKGQILTQVSTFWLQNFFSDVKNHLITTELPAVLENEPELQGRSTIVKRADMLPLECIVRGYLYGSVMSEYKKQGTATGIKLPKGLVKASELPEPIFTPSTKATVGHDENITEEQALDLVGPSRLLTVKRLSLEIYDRARKHALKSGIILADTKFEFGIDENGAVILCDEVLTPDSSRYWDAETYKAGEEPVSYDKQFVRNYCSGLGWDKKHPGPELPDEIVVGTQERYEKIAELLIDKSYVRDIE